MTPTIEEYLEGDLIPQVEDYDEYWRAFGFVPEEGEPKDVLSDLQKGVDNCYFDFKGSDRRAFSAQPAPANLS